MAPPRILLTGATGFLGREVLLRLLHRGRHVLVTSRRREGEGPEDLERRMREMLAQLDPGPWSGRLTATFADVTQADLALDESGRAWLEHGGPVHLVHGAAEVRFDLPLARMREQNVQGTRNVLALAARLDAEDRLHRMDHVSTAYVAGDRVGLVSETDIDVGQRPRNAYEQTKLESELEVEKARASGLAVTVHRPSIIVGDSRTGRAASFKVLYWPMKVYARGRFRTVFGRPDCPIDVVPVDFVADAIVTLMDCPDARNRTVHLAAGPAGQASIESLSARASEIFGRRRVRYIDPDFYLRWLRPIVRPILRLLRPDVAERGGVYLPYLRCNPTFDTSVARALLSEAGIEPPPVETYFERIMRYAIATDFGRDSSVRALPSPPAGD